MGCLTAKASRRDALSLEASRLDALRVECRRRDALMASASLICTISTNAYLLVSPEETQWVSEWNTAVYDVHTNMDWKAG